MNTMYKCDVKVADIGINGRGPKYTFVSNVTSSYIDHV